MQSRYYGAIVEHKFSYCQGENVAGKRSAFSRVTKTATESRAVRMNPFDLSPSASSGQACRRANTTVGAQNEVLSAAGYQKSVETWNEIY